MGSNMREPFGISVALALHQREVRCLQLFGDRTATAFADRTIVDLANRRDFSGGAGEERLVGDIDLVARDASFDDLVAEILCQLHDRAARDAVERAGDIRSEEHTSELQSLMRISYAVFCLKKKNKNKT